MKRTLFAVLMMGVMAHTAHALTSGNPISEQGAGDLGAGLSLSDDAVLIFGDYGVAENSTVRGFIGSLDLDGAKGTVYGAGYRHGLGIDFDLGGNKVETGALGYYTNGTLEVSGYEFSYSQIDLGAGATMEVAENMRPYLILAWRQVSVDSTSDSEVGFALGLDYGIDDNLKAGLEYHGFDETETIVYVEYAF